MLRKTVADRRHGVVLQFRVYSVGPTTPHDKIIITKALGQIFVAI
jgi:hypothetical protein